MNVSEAIILAGGKGKRMRSITQDKIPKSLTLIQSHSILEWELIWLAREKVSHVILATGHLSDVIEKKMGNEYSCEFGKVDLTFSREKEKLGSGGAVKLASEKLSTNQSYLVNGDILSDARLEKMKSLHFSNDVHATMYLTKMRSPYGVVQFENNLITEFKEKPLLDVYIHGGIDIISSDQFNRFPERGQMEDTIFVEFANENKFGAYKAKEEDFWMSIDSEKDYDIANSNWTGVAN